MNVLITEKPSVAREFAKVLNVSGKANTGYLESKDWIITWCVGHLVTMSYPEKYDEKYKLWRLDMLPFIPQEFKYEVIEGVKKQYEIVSSLLRREDVDKIYVATDSGREGEYIYRLVAQEAGVQDKETRRVWIDSQTEEEIKRGINEAKEESFYDSISDSAYLRAKEDYLIGINFSRLLTLIYGKRAAKDLGEDRISISVGRVMTCVLGMIVSREREIINFVKTPYYKVIGSFEKNGEKFNAEWKVNENSEYLDSEKLYNDSGFKKEESAKELIAKLAGKKATVKEIKKSKQKENAPLLFNLAEIQNECTKRFKIKPSETLDIIQELYEKKLVTYPRTDARVLSTAVSKEISKNLNGIKKGFKDEEVQSILDKMINEKYSTKLEKTKYVNDNKITDHYAIIPTGQGFENYDKLPDLQKDIYKLIVKRFLSIFYPAAEFSKVNLKLEVVNNDKKEEFNTSGRVCEIQGYLEIWKDKEETKEENNEEQEEVVSNIDILAKLKKNDEINIDNFEVKEGQTNPPSRYNSGNLILAMENAGKLIEDEALREQIKGAGIGTSATRGEIIKKLERIGYIAINSKTQIVTPTKKGEVIYDVVDKSMPDMLNPKLTASWEKGLEMVANKEIQKDIFMEKLEKYIHSKFDRLIRR